MYKYVIGLCCGGLMEDPEWHIEDVKEVSANNLREAKAKWAKVTNHDKTTHWKKESQTVWGWSVRVLVTEDPDVPDNEFYKYIKEDRKEWDKNDNSKK